MTSSGKWILACGFITAVIVGCFVGVLVGYHFRICEEAIGWYGDPRIVCEPKWDLGWLAGIAVFLVVKILSFQLSLLWSIADRLNPENIDDNEMASPEVVVNDSSSP